MTKYNGFKVAALAASIAFAMGSTAVMAAAPAATQLPGQGKVLKGAAPTVTIDTTTNTMNIVLSASNIIDWGAGTTLTDINSTGVAGFNIGADAKVNFTGGLGVLNLDSTGNPSQIFGKLTNVGNVFVANENGIIVGPKASIRSTSGAVGLIANTLDTTAFDGSLGKILYNGTSTGSGDITVQAGAAIAGGTPTNTVLISGAGAVNVDLAAVTGKLNLLAGVSTGGAFAENNPAASLDVTGSAAGSTLNILSSAGTATTNGDLTLTTTAVDGVLTNNGVLTLGTAFAIKGALVNNKTATQTADVSVGSLTNNGEYVGAGHALATTDGGITNGGSLTGMGNVTVDGGDFVNNGSFDAGTNGLNTYGGGNVVNQGDATLDHIYINEGGNFSNDGTMVLTDGVWVRNGSITNNGKLKVDNYLETVSDVGAGGFTAGAQYFITNTGTITSAGDLQVSANSDYWGDYDGDATNDSTGSVSNTGTLQVGNGNFLQLQAHNGVNLAGTVQADDGTGKYKALSATNALGGLYIYAGGYDGSVLNSEGVATVATDIVSNNSGIEIYGNQVKLMSNLSAVDSAGDPDGTIAIVAGAKSDTDYAVRVASGKTVMAESIYLDGARTDDQPNVILQGTLSGNDVRFGDSNAVSDVFSGPAGGIVATGSNPNVDFNFTGAIKTAKYLNNANFRYNYLPITVDGTDPVEIWLDNAAFETNGTSNGLSAVNILVNGDAYLVTTSIPTEASQPSAVTGVFNWQNTHLVLQSTGNIETDGNDYWPGYIYLGNIAADADGVALPGTLGLGQITLGGDLNNVLPGSIDNGGGIHFITQFPMVLGTSKVTTNANSWVNFGTELLTSAYAAGTQGAGLFFGGAAGSGSVVNYGALDASMFHTHAPDATK